MKSFSLAFAAVCALMISVVAVGNAEEKKEAKTVKCPVAGKEIKVSDAKTVSYAKATLYVCCNGCKGKVEKDAAKYALKANHQVFQTGQYKQTKCPISGRALDSTKTVKMGGVDVQFCCAGCQGKAKKASGDDQLKLAFSDQAFKKGFELAKK